MVGRLLSLAPEVLVAGALLVSFLCLLTAGAMSGRVSRLTLLVALSAALAACVLFRSRGDELLFGVYRVDALSQLAKLAVLAGSLLAATSARGEDRWAAKRVTSPFFHAAATLALLLAASTVDLLAGPLTWWLACVASVLLASSVGRWAVLEKIVRRSLAGLMAATVATMTGALLVAASGESTRLEALRALESGRPMVQAIGLLLWASVAGWMIAVAPFLLRRSASDTSGSRAAPVLAATAMVAAGGLVLVRALALAAGRLSFAVAGLLLAAAIAPSFAAAADRFARSFGRRAPALLTGLAALALAGWLLWPWIVTAAGELD